MTEPSSLSISLALDDGGYVYSWGFGGLCRSRRPNIPSKLMFFFLFSSGLGRLGHGEQKDLLLPKLLPVFAHHNQLMRGAKVAAGSTNSLVVDGQGMFYLAGK
jgi:alpha-tubulin suppressor-like RCC1 family protein